MTVQSNLYVEKLVTEHPLAYWMLNETVDYVSTVLESERNISNNTKWSITNGTAYNETSPPDSTPFLASYTTRLERAYPFGSTTVKAQSIINISNSKINFDLKNICVSGYVFITTSNIASISYGYTYYDPSTGSTITKTASQNISSFEYGTWVFFSETFDLPTNTNATNFNPFFSFIATGSSGTSGSDYSVLINGFTIGQWSELFNSYSLGVHPQSLPEDIALPSTLKSLAAYPYGSSNDLGYYICSDKQIYSKNFAIPLVYGSSNATDLYPGPVIDQKTYPSLIFPGHGFLNQKGKYNNYTVEMWIRLNSDSAESYRIFGPIASNDGLYVESGFLTLVVGKKFKSYYVGEWFRPMLIHIRYIGDNISVLLNGEEIINITLYEDDLEFPLEYTIIDSVSKSQDWLGFYAYENIHPLTIDCFSIFSYSVAKEVAKRRWVWGQAVVPIGTTNASLGARTITNDYTYSKYAVNYSYPDFAKFKQGFANNVDASSKNLKLPDYKLPIINLGTKTTDSWYMDLYDLEKDLNTKYFKFAPTNSWDQTSSYFYFKDLSFLNIKLESMYGIFESDGTSLQDQVLFKLVNKANSDSLLISINQTTVKYIITLNGVTSILKQQTITANQKFTIGLNLTKVSLLNYANIAKFFESLSNISLYVGGDDNSYFTGKIYKVGFDSQYNNKKINTLYDSSGFFIYSSANTLINHTANYTLVPILKFGIFFADIAVAGYWQDYMPLTYFAKYVKDNNNELVYDLDFLQFNIDYPEPIETFEQSATSTINYGELNSKFATPFQKTYSYLDNSSYTGWTTYEEMRLASVTTYFYSTEKAAVKSYVSFQNIADGANKTLSDFTNKVPVLSSSVVDPNIISTPWETSAYSVVDGSIIYPPLKNIQQRSVDFNNIGIVYHIEFTVPGIYHNSVSLKKLQLVSQVLNAVDFTPVGTKYGIDIYPYSKLGLYYDFKRKNPISTYKGTTPYLYLTRHSGWRLRGDFDIDLDRGISIPINKEKVLGVELNSIQVWCKYTEKQFPTGEIRFLSLTSSNTTYDFYFNADETKDRAKIYAKDRTTGLIQNQFNFYVNGKFSNNPYIVREEWASLSISFDELLDFNGFAGRLNLNGPLIYNNISYYVSSNLEQEQRIQKRSWQQVLGNSGSELTWSYWEASVPPADGLWNTVKVISVSQFALVDPSVSYTKYIGNDRIVVDDNFGGLLVKPQQIINSQEYDEIRLYGTTEWSTSTRIAV